MMRSDNFLSSSAIAILAVLLDHFDVSSVLTPLLLENDLNELLYELFACLMLLWPSIHILSIRLSKCCRLAAFTNVVVTCYHNNLLYAESLLFCYPDTQIKGHLVELLGGKKEYMTYQIHAHIYFKQNGEVKSTAWCPSHDNSTSKTE